MKQNKIILVAEDNDAVFRLIGKALAGTAEAHPILRVRSGKELGDLLSAGQAAGGVVPDAAYILIVDALLLQSDSYGFLPWMARSDLRARMLVVVLVDQDDQKTVNKYQGMGTSVTILKSEVEAELSDTVSKLGSFLAVVQGPRA